jgi:imidazolonepropionase-like amidohydrolase
MPDFVVKIANDRGHRQTRTVAICLILVAIVYINSRFIASHLYAHPALASLDYHYAQNLNAGLAKCARFQTAPKDYTTSDTARRHNPRWNPVSGQKDTLVLLNATLFDGDSWIGGRVNIVLEKGIITSVHSVSENIKFYGSNRASLVDLHGAYVTPGLVDMHSHHLVGTWPALRATEDTNEMNDKSQTTATGPLTPFVRSLDSFKPYDIATDIIRSGGVTSSLILPGSANIMGGAAYPVKNVLRAGPDAEESVEELLLEYGVPEEDRRRYLKMACGENPKRVYTHTRMGNAWIFRHHLERAAAFRQKQDEWCLSALAARESNDPSLIVSLSKSGLPEDLELDTTVGLLRGQVDLHNHCYEPEDFSAMLRHSKEFGYKIRAFHHALSAWKVPKLIKASGQNITIATFQDFALYKQEGYEGNLYAGKILNEHGMPVAYKSDHNDESTSAKYLLFQAQGAHAFGLNAEAALRAVTSVPARSLRLDHRVGYAKPGFDADLVVWSGHPLKVGAAPLQVYVDGRETIDEELARKHLVNALKNDRSVDEQTLNVRPDVNDVSNQEICHGITGRSNVVITGIKKSLHDDAVVNSDEADLVLVLTDGIVSCFGLASSCVVADETIPRLDLHNGHALPGLTAVVTGLGLAEIGSEGTTTDGGVKADLDISDPSNLIYARYGIHLDGRAFGRAQIGGVTRAISIPHVDNGGFGGAVSVGIKTSQTNTTFDGGIFQSEVGLHLVVGQPAKTGTGTVSGAVAKLRKLLTDNSGKAGIYGDAVKGDIPLVIHTENHVSGHTENIWSFNF